MNKIQLGIDIGSSKTAIYQVGAGVILCEPSVVAVTAESRGRNVTVGLDAKKLFGKTSQNTQVFLPVFEGAIEKENAADMMLGGFFDKIELKSFGKAVSAVVAVPCGSSALEIKRYKELINSQNIYKIKFVESPIATALGLNIPISQSTPCFIIDMGGGTTNIAALSLDGMIAGVNVNMGGGNVDAMIIDYIENEYSLKIGLLTAEKIKIELGSLLEGDCAKTVISGRDVKTGKPRSLLVTAADIVEPIKAYINKINEIAEMLMAKLPAEVSAEIRNKGIYLSGGMSKIVGIKEYFANNFSSVVNIAEAPELAVAVGLGILQANESLLRRVQI